MKYYKVHVISTSRAVGSRVPSFDSGFRVYDEFDKTFKTLQEAKTWIKSAYGKHSRFKIYVDKKDGTAQHIGYGYRLGINGYTDNDKAYEQRLVDISEVKETVII